jgi:formylmethanofuran dehydrogenase subunit E
MAMYRCENCGEEFPEKEIWRLSSGEWVCDYCYWERCEQCIRCGYTTYRERLYYYVSGGNRKLCKSCYDEWRRRHWGRHW